MQDYAPGNNQEKISASIAGYASHYLPVPLRYLFALEANTSYFLSFTALLALTLLVIFYRLGEHGIINGNESLYIESAREMLVSGNLAIPTLNGLPYLEKPPLFIWLLAAAIELFGSGELVYRLATALGTLFLVISISRFSKALGITRTGTSAGFFLITSIGIDIMSRVAMPDMFLTTLFTVACLHFFLALRTQRRSNLRICAALLGAASLTKGLLPIALFFIIAITFYWMHPRRRAAVFTLIRDPVAALLLCLPLSLWLLAIELSQPGAIYDFIINEHVLRYLGLREPHDYYSGSIFYYVPRLLLFFFPWIGVLACGWLACARSQDQATSEIRSFLWLCVWVPFGFFSLSNAKANYYIILCLPPMAILLAHYLPTLLKDRHRIKLTMAIILPLVILIALWAYRLWALSTGRILPQFSTYDDSMPLTPGIIIVLGLVALFLIQVDRRNAAVLCLGGLLLPLSIEFNHMIVQAEPQMSARTMAMYIQENYPDKQVLLFQDFESFGALPIYLGRTIPVIDSKSADLFSGQKKFPVHPNFLTEDQLVKIETGALIVVMRNKEALFAQTKIKKALAKVIEIGPAALYRIMPAK